MKESLARNIDTEDALTSVLDLVTRGHAYLQASPDPRATSTLPVFVRFTPRPDEITKLPSPSTRTTHDTRHTQASSAPRTELLASLSRAVSRPLRVFGVLPQAGGDGGDGAAESKEAEILDTLARFRQQVPCPHCLLAVPRHPRPSPLSPDQRASGSQVRKTAISSANVKKDVLSLCDQLRDKDLPAVGFRLEVNPRFVS